eukprot:5285395-Pleurochrysis_carterae.AAC.2
MSIGCSPPHVRRRIASLLIRLNSSRPREPPLHPERAVARACVPHQVHHPKRRGRSPPPPPPPRNAHRAANHPAPP